MEKNKCFASIKICLICAALYFVFDFPVRLTEFFDFGSFIGLKCLLPIICGLLFGCFGALGCSLGSLVTNLICTVTVGDFLYEIVLCFLSGTLTWLIWHIFEKSGRVNLKNIRKLFLYIFSVTLSSLICAALGALFGGTSYFVSVLVAYLILGIIVGVPVLSIAVSIVCIDTTAPFFRKKTNDIEFSLTRTDDISELNQIIEAQAAAKAVPMNSVLKIQNCIEEAIIRIFSDLSETKIKLTLDMSDSLSLKMNYDGARYNPIEKQKNEDQFTAISLTLVRLRALRVRYVYKKGHNFLHIVV